MSMKVGIGGQNGAVLASQAEGCEFKSRFPLQENQAFTVKNTVKAFYFCDQIATCGRKKSFFTVLLTTLSPLFLSNKKTPLDHVFDMTKGRFFVPP